MSTMNQSGIFVTIMPDSDARLESNYSTFMQNLKKEKQRPTLIICSSKLLYTYLLIFNLILGN